MLEHIYGIVLTLSAVWISEYKVSGSVEPCSAMKHCLFFICFFEAISIHFHHIFVLSDYFSCAFLGNLKWSDGYKKN